MNAENFNFVVTLIRERSGLALGADKSYLVESRLLSVARKWEIKSADELVSRLRTRHEPLLIQNVVEAAMNHESYFFRDLKPFEQFRNVALPYLLSARTKRRPIRIWCAACSSGQEPYSLAMILAEERAKLEGWNVEILATDLSTEILAKARTGSYSQFEVQRGLPIQFLIKYFRRQNERWVVDGGIREMIRFRPFNLLDDLTELGTFDVIFCRNVLLYLEPKMRTDVLSRLSKRMNDDGFLYIGGTEDIHGVSDKFVPVPQNYGVYHPARA